MNNLIFLNWEGEGNEYWQYNLLMYLHGNAIINLFGVARTTLSYFPSEYFFLEVFSLDTPGGLESNYF
jgi:hypothetical protein